MLGLVILYLRRFLPESPRWLMMHGRPGEAARVVGEIEARVMASEQRDAAAGDRDRWRWATTHKLTLALGGAHAAAATIPAAPCSASC